MKRIAIALSVAIAVSSAAAESILEYAKRTASRYPDAVGASAFGIELTARTYLYPTPDYLRAKYDAANRTIVMAYNREGAQFGNTAIYRECKSEGSYVAQNAFNAKIRVTRQTCNEVRVRGPDDDTPIGMTYRDVFGVKIKGASPADAREIHGFDAAFLIETVPPTDGDYVTIYRKDGWSASYTDPYDVTNHQYTISAKLKRVAFYRPGAPQPFAVKDPHVDEYTE